MKEQRRRRLPWVLMALGALMALFALAMLLQTPKLLQYSVLAPEPGEKGETLLSLIEPAHKVGQDLKDSLSWAALGGVCGSASITSDTGSEEVNLIAMDEGWLEVYPRFLIKGRRIGESELQRGARVVMLDDALAFRLFGTDLPEDATVPQNGAKYQVVGTVRHGGSVFGGRGVGDTLPADAYLPLRAAIADNVDIQALTLSAIPQGGAGATRLFLDAATQWSPGGQLIDLSKEAMRRTILPRVLLLIVGLYALVGLFGRMTGAAGRLFGGYRQALKQSYFTALIPKLLGVVALTLLGYAALVGLTYLLMVFSAQPLYVFTEWVPENIVEWTSISRVFWNLTADAGRLVRVGTRELRVVEFWGGLLRWGVILVLLGAALLPKEKRGSKEQAIGNRQ